MLKVKLVNSTVEALIDDKFLYLYSYRWLLSKDGYVFRYGNPGFILMHHDVIGRPPKGLETDHKNRIRHDNQSLNLHHVTHAQNMQNRSPRKKTSKYLGVFLKRENGKWRARIKKNCKIYQLGTYKHEIDAAIAYDLAALRLYGPTATLNLLNQEKSKNEKIAV